MANTIIGIVVGFILRMLFDKWKKRVAVIKYKINHQSLGTSTKPIEILYNKIPVKNVFSSMIEIKNDSPLDIKNAVFKIKGADKTIFLSDFAFKNDPSIAIQWTSEYLGLYDNLQSNMNVIMHNREYLIPVFNRGDKLLFSLSTSTQSGELPNIIIQSDYIGMRLKCSKIQQEMWGIPIAWATIIGWIATILMCILINMVIHNKFFAVFIALILGWIVILIGYLLIKAFYLILKLIR